MHFQLLFGVLMLALAADEEAYVFDDNFQRSILESSNNFRELYNAAELRWNDSLADYAETYVSQCDFVHSRGPYGENLAAGYDNPSAAVQAWGAEGNNYNGDYTDETGHFTQLVWKGTRSVGCGRANCSGRKKTPGWYLACEYWPRGNVIGDFPANVQAPTISSSDDLEWASCEV